MRESSAYYAEIQAADEDLQLSLTTLRKDEDAHRLTTMEAAQERIKLMEDHLAHVQRLRREYEAPRSLAWGDTSGEGSGCSV